MMSSPPVALGKGKPSAEAERRRDWIVGNSNFQIVARDVDLEDVRFVVAGLSDEF